MPTIQHLLETRFSVRMGRRELTLEWLRERLGLLRQFTQPSVEAQTSQEFTWLLLCDETTDPEVLAELREEEHRLPPLRVTVTGERQPEATALHNAVSPNADVLITTRLDSDDAIASEYVEAVQGYVDSFFRSQCGSLLVNFPHGYRLETREGRLFEDWMPNSSFHSLLERPRQAAASTVRNARAPHVRLHQYVPTHQDESMPGWLIAVHGGNLINCIGERNRELPAGSRPVGIAVGTR